MQFGMQDFTSLLADCFPAAAVAHEKCCTEEGCTKEECPKCISLAEYTLGIDEAGRGPVLGPLVYGAFIARKSDWDLLNSLNAKDSKALTINHREAFVVALQNFRNHFGWVTDATTAEDLSRRMLAKGKAKENLNVISQQSAVTLIRRVLAHKVRLVHVYVDALGNDVVYESRLKQLFPQIDFTVRPKADALFPVVSAASIIAKVRRDFLLSQWQPPLSLTRKLLPLIDSNFSNRSSKAVSRHGETTTSQSSVEDKSCEPVAVPSSSEQCSDEQNGPSDCCDTKQNRTFDGASRDFESERFERAQNMKDTSDAIPSVESVESADCPLVSSGKAFPLETACTTVASSEASTLATTSVSSSCDSLATGTTSDASSTTNPIDESDLLLDRSRNANIVGSGYPGGLECILQVRLNILRTALLCADPKTKQFLQATLDPVFGFPSIVRFSWQTAKSILDDPGKDHRVLRVNWYDNPNCGEKTHENGILRATTIGQTTPQRFSTVKRYIQII